jgi:hypothetical protein
VILGDDLISTLRNLCVLCASAVKEAAKHVNRRGAEDAENTQRTISNSICDPGLLRILGGDLISTLRNLGVLCASAVKEAAKHVNRRGRRDYAENHFEFDL